MSADFLSRLKKEPEEILGAALLPPPRKPNGPNDYGLRGRGLGGGTGLMPKYPSAEALKFTVDEYFTQLEYRRQDGEDDAPPTMAGLALALGFSSTQTLKNYADRGEDYAWVLDTARTKIEQWKNELLLKGGSTTQAAIFDLKNNHHWADKVEKTTTVNAGDSLMLLVQELQGKVHRPAISTDDYEIEEAEYEEWEEEITPTKKQPVVFREDLTDAEEVDLDSDLRDLI